MENTWLENYILLMLRLDKIFKKDENFYVDAYIGPEKLKDLVEKEKFKKEIELIKDLVNLLSKLKTLDFKETRTSYLKKQLEAVKMILRILNGDKATLKEQVESILDIDFKWVDETNFERGLAYFKQGLPGKGDLINRYGEWTKRNMYSFKNSQQKYDYLKFIIDEMRNRSKNIIELPENEDVNLEIVTDKRYGASTRYLGNLVSLVEINDDIPFNFYQMLPLITHELYPGHHAEFCLKESYLVKEKNYFENNIFLLTSPQLVISEGIGEVAFDMIFTPQQAAEWMDENIYKKYNIKTDDIDLVSLIKASRLNSLDQLSSNASILMNEGRDEKEIKDYIQKYTLQPEYMLDHVIKNLKSSPLQKVYSFTYYHGKQIVQNYLNEKEDKAKALNHLMKKQVYPSQIK